jgi:hypothetical protein
MDIKTEIITDSLGDTTLDITVKDCEGFTVNEWMDYNESKRYLETLKASVERVEHYLKINNGND